MSVLASLTGPVWAGRYARRASVWTGSKTVHYLPEGVVALWEETGSGGRLWLPGHLPGPETFSRDPASGDWVLVLEPEMTVEGFEARASGLVGGVGVEVLRVWGERALVREAGSPGVGEWVGLGDLSRVVVDQGGRRALRIGRDVSDPSKPAPFGRPYYPWTVWRRVFPAGFDAWSSPGRAGGVGAGAWPSSWQGPVPASGTWLLVFGGVPYPCEGTSPREPYYPTGEDAYYVDLDGWAPLSDGPVGLRSIGSRVVSQEVAMSVEGVDGMLVVSEVSASYRGRRVEVRYVAYAYAYVVDWDSRDSLPFRRRMRDMSELDVLEGPVRLDELEDIRFKVSVSERCADSGYWDFLEVWGLDGDLGRDGGGVRVQARMERGAWQAWPATHKIGEIWKSPSLRS